MVSVCMLTELERYRAIIPFKNPGGMGTNVPMVARELEKVGVRVLLNQPKGEYDVLHVHSPLPDSFLWALRRRKEGKPLVVHGRHLPELVKGGFKGGSWIYPFVRSYSVKFYNLGDVVVGATPYVAKSLARDGVRGPFRVIPNGVSKEVFKRNETLRIKFRERWGLSESDKLVLSVGLRIPRKGVDTFVNMSSKFKDRKDVKFVWVGASEALLKDALDRTSPGNVMFPGHVPFEEIVGVYSAADVFVFPTRAESYGNVMLEAASCGCPLLIRDIPVYEEWVRDGQHCLKAKDDEDFSKKLGAIIDDAGLRRRLVDGAGQLASEHDIRKTALMLKELYESLSAGGGAARST
ncbi:MAG: glycosyltransferase family 4 protein [Thermoplasmatota archaeon]|nr:glycosyltransferase family 4 protein [Candidatus Thermoplasmatota archaeon]MBU1914806.1 glycosyltransferase family 4 protein [Candidatus Thermoplasmatota archaeon]